MRLSPLLAGPALAFAVLSACSTPNHATTDESDLSNGQVAADDAFPSTFAMENGCTVTHIGENLILTAAHCVREANGSLRSDVAPGKQFVALVRSKVGKRRTLTIARTTIHPRIAELCATQGCGAMASTERRDAPDVAVIAVAGGLDDVPIASIDVDPTAEGDAVTILGFGCTGGVDDFNPDGKLRFQDTQIVGVAATIHPGGLAASETGALENVRANYAITPGPRGAALEAGAQAGLCPGDSGGALYRKGTDRVVGINSSYTFLPSEKLPVTNWHARVDGDARWGVAAWLESQGAHVTRPCTDDACQPVRTTGAGQNASASDAGRDAP